jgi:hypothetical protein
MLEMEGVIIRSDIDNHSDAIVLGKHCLVLNDFDRPVEVQGYDPGGPIYTARTITGAVGYQDRVTGGIVILIFHQALHLPHLEHNLISPFPLREYGLLVHETPKFQTENPTDETHCIIVMDCELPADELIIPLEIHRINSYFPTFKPTVQQYKSCERVFTMTAESPEWNPSDMKYAEQEAALGYNPKGNQDSVTSIHIPKMEDK